MWWGEGKGWGGIRQLWCAVGLEKLICHIDMTITVLCVFLLEADCASEETTETSKDQEGGQTDEEEPMEQN